MKRLIAFLLLVVFVICGCAKQAPKNKEILAKINNYEITKEEFDEEFKLSAYGRIDTPDSRKEFLNMLINRKVILQDAEAKGIDRDKDFLKMVERFWEQSLLKLTLDRKAKEVAGAVVVTDKEIEAVYNKLKEEGKTDKPYDQLYNQIKWELTRVKESRILGDWMASLRSQADTKLNLNLLDLKADNK
ncbi:MAG: SurA N-terminal domain-containing protein [Candidatus Omnitrophota bacterium]